MKARATRRGALEGAAICAVAGIALLGSGGCAGGGGGGGSSASVLATSIDTAALPDATEGEAYAATLRASGGNDPLSWTISAGALPPGLALSPATGRSVSISGTPAVPGAYPVTVRATDARGEAAERSYVLEVVGALAIATATLPPGETRDPYAETIRASGGKAPYAWSLLSGAPPAGLALVTGTASTIELRGTCAGRGVSTLTLRVDDARGRSASATLSVRVDDIERHVYGGKIDTNSREQLYVTERVNGVPQAPRPLLENIYQGSFAFLFPCSTSPDGRYAAAIMDRDVPNAFDLFVVDLKGPSAGRVRRANPAPFGGVAPQEVKRMFWSPDSRWIGFVGDVATAGVDDLFVADVSAPATMTAVNVTQYVAGQGLSFWDASFTADGRHVVFIGDGNPNPLSNPAGWMRQLYYADLASPVPTPIRLSIPLTDPANMDVEAFSVASSGSGVAYRGDLIVDGVQDVFYVPLSGGQAGVTRRLSDAASAHAEVAGPWVSPDGGRVLFTSGVSPTQGLDSFGSPVPGHLAFVADVRGASPCAVTLGASDGSAQQPVWSPDGAHVLLYRQPDGGSGTVQGGELLWLDAASGGSARLNAEAWDGPVVDVAHQQGPWGPMGLDAWAYGVSPDGATVCYKQETATGSSFFGNVYKTELFTVEVSAATLTAVLASPDVAGLTEGGVTGEPRWSADSRRLALAFDNTQAGSVTELYVRDLPLGVTSIVAASTSARLNNNAPGPKFTPDGGLVASGPFSATSAAYNQVFYFDLAGGRQELTPVLPSNGDQSDFFPLD